MKLFALPQLLATLVLAILMSVCAPTQAQTISTFAGGIGDDSLAATYGRITSPNYLMFDQRGNLYFTETSETHLLRKINANGNISRVAGNGTRGSTGDYGAAVNAMLYIPNGIAKDRFGNIYVCEGNYVRKIDTNGTISRFAGCCQAGSYSGDGSLAGTAALNNPVGIVADTLGNVYIADRGNLRIRKVDTAGIISTFAGAGSGGYSGDSVSARYAQLISPTCVAIDRSGNLLIAERCRLRKVTPSGIIYTVAGNPYSSSSTGDGGPATAATFRDIIDIKLDRAGNIFISSSNDVRKINTSGIVSTVAGGPSGGGFSGDGGPATSAIFNSIGGIAIDTSGNLYIGDKNNNRIRKVNSTGIISTIAGNYNPVDSDGLAATKISWGQASMPLYYSWRQVGVLGITTDTAGNVYFGQMAENIVRKVDNRGIVSTVAGNRFSGYYGDGGAATSAALDKPSGLAMDKRGNMYIAEYGSHHVRKVSATGVITTVAGGGSTGLGDGGPATAAVISTYGMCLDTAANIYILDADSGRIRRVDAHTGIISTVAGDGSQGFSGDGGPATAASFYFPMSITVDKRGNIFVADAGNYRVRKIDANGIISTYAGRTDLYYYYPNYEGGLGDGGLAKNAQLRFPRGVFVDSVGAVYVLDAGAGGASGENYLTYHHRIRKIDQYGYIHTVAGNGFEGYSGDGGSATNAEISDPYGLALDNRGNLYFGDNRFKGIRKVCCMTTNADRPPLFARGETTSMSICTGISGVRLDSFLSVTDGDLGDTLRWTVDSTPRHGSIAGSLFTTVATGSAQMPTAFSYTPAAGYSGIDTFTIRVTDGHDYSLLTIYVNTIAPPARSTVTGPTSICITDSATLTASLAGGTWGHLRTGVTVTSAGVMTGVATGNDTIVYAITNMCGTAVTTMGVNVGAPPALGIISTPSPLCIGTSATLSSSVAGGSWTTTDPYINIGRGTGIVVGVAAGTALVTYTTTNSCGTASDTALVNVVGAPPAPTVTGPAFLCVSDTATFRATATGGTWSVSNAAIATIGVTGHITALTGGATLISYTQTTTCGTTVAVALLNVSTSTSIGPITGASALCTGTTTTLAHSLPGGTWASSTPSIATISTTGVVTGRSPGVATISYTLSAGCGVSIVTTNITVNATPVAGTVSGPATLCVGASSVVSSSATAGVWSTTTGAAASVSPTGVLTGLSSGTATVTYTVTNSCGSDTATFSFAVAPTPVAGTISGLGAVCAGSNITLSASGSGGSWSSASPAIATVSSAGVVTGIGTGVATISYTVSTGCGTAAATFSVNATAPTAGTLTGITTLCTGATSALSSTVSGGSWSTSTAMVASVSAAGLVTAVAPGTTIITYTTTSTCGSATATATVTVGTTPSIAAIAGTIAVCAGGSSALTNATTGGTWSSSAPTVATVSNTGVVYGIVPGSATISYTVGGTCGSASVTTPFTVQTTPSAGTIVGATVVCQGANTTLTDSVAGGAWNTSSGLLATINASGIVSGLAVGTVTISHSVTNSCGTSTTVHTLAVNAAPNAGTLSGATSVCAAATTTLTSSVTGGTWASSNPAIASITTTGTVTGNAAGSVTMTYSTTNSCGTATATWPMTVNALPVAGTITGAAALCPGTSVTLSSTTAGGTWSTGSSVVSVSAATGVVTGITAGTAIVTYSVANSCGSTLATDTITVGSGPSAGTITGSATVCIGASVTLSTTVAGGSWSSSDTSILTIGSGRATGIVAGTASVTYSVTNACGTDMAIHTLTVSPAPVAGTITGTATVCAGSSATFSTTGTGGTWASSAPGIATVSSSGVVTGIAAGIVIISYSVTTGCGTDVATLYFTVNTATAGVVSGTTTLCAGSSAALSASVTGGSWSVSAATVATVDGSGMLMALSAGSCVVTYSTTGACGAAAATTVITVNPMPYAGPITGTTTVAAGSTTVLSNSAPGGTWTTADASIASVDGSGMVTGVAAGSTSITYSITNVYGCRADTSTTIVVGPPTSVNSITKATAYELFPNPATGQLQLQWENVGGNQLDVLLLNALGQIVLQRTITLSSSNGNAMFDLTNLPRGTYTLQARNATGTPYTTRVVLD